MSITSKGKRWELLHSLWIGWTFTFGLFHWVAFFYAAFRAKRRRWVLWGILYMIPFVMSLFPAVIREDSGWLGNLWVTLLLILAVVSTVHAFVIRKEYLVRLAALQQRRASDVEVLRRLMHNFLDQQIG